MQKMIFFVAVAAMLQGAPVLAQTSPFAWSAGYSSYKLRPESGTNEQMNGYALGGEYTCHPGWAVEVDFNHQTGTEADAISLRQQGVMAGLKSTWTAGGKYQGFTHFLIGREQLRASSGPEEDERTSFAYGPGIGMDLTMTSHLSARGQVDFIITHYSGKTQGSPALFVGLVYR
jgi:hypothetical protein